MKKLTIVIIIIVVVLAGVAIWYFTFRTEKQVIVLETEKPVRGYISQSVTATGTIQPVDTVAVGTQVSGTLKTLYADFNSVVKKGQLLAELDKTLFMASVNQYIANLAQVQSQLVYQQGNYSRQSQLYKIGAISKSDYDNALYSYNSAKAEVASINAQLQSARKNLSLASIYSPIDGTVLSRSVSEGQTLAASFNTPTLFSIAKDLTKMQVRAAVDEADIGDVHQNERATFTVDAFLKDVFKGTVQEIRLSPTTASNVVTYTTIINAPNSDKKLKPGMTANITIFTKEVDSALLIPVKAIKFIPDSTLSAQYEISYEKGGKSDFNNTYVWIKEGSKLIQRKIKIGINDNTQVEVLEGLSEKEEIVTNSKQLSSKEAKATGVAASPFMPRRPGGGNNRKK
jgi:HlyD family secretion protein